MGTLTADLYNQARQASTACRVPSFTTKDAAYECRDVFTPFASCTCDDFKYRRQGLVGDDRVCKHLQWSREAIMEIMLLVRSLRDRIEDPLSASV